MSYGSAREKILDTAEALFAENGIDAVSLRAVNAAAGVSPGVLHYHFGGRDKLVEAIIDRRMTPLMETRRRMIETLTDRNDYSIRDVIAVLIDPLYELISREGGAGRRYIRFIARLFSDHSELLMEANRRGQHQFLAKLPALIQQCEPGLSGADIEQRLIMANYAMLNFLGDPSPLGRPWIVANDSDDESVVRDNLMEFISGGFGGTGKS